MLETSARLLRLLALFQNRRYWTGAGLAGRLEVTPRTVRRDVDKLRSLGYPVHSSPGAEGGYQMGAGQEMPPLLLDDDEAVAVAAGLRQIAGIEEASARAMAKIDQILPARLQRRVAALQAAVVTAPSVPVDAKTLALFASACRDSLTLRFRYQDHGGKSSLRAVEPHRLVHAALRWYLVAWDLTREDWRTFRIDRVAPRATTGAAFRPRPAPAKDLADFVQEGYWRSRETCRARVRLLLPLEEAARCIPCGAGVLEAGGSAWCWLAAASTCWDSLAMRILWTGADFEVDGPDELRLAFARMAARCATAAGSRTTAKGHPRAADTAVRRGSSSLRS
jgi:predicted DNA-binding transcriptional regulator YafY